MISYNKNDPDTIRKMFNSIARQYDRTNGVLSFQMHKRWNRTLIEHAIIPVKPQRLLDLCCGTGAIAFAYLKQQPQPTKAFLLDFSEGMLAYAQEQSKGLERHDLSFLQADAQLIPLPDSSVDCATIAYGIRNIKHPQQCLNEVYRVLQEGGTFGILELTQPQNPLMRLGHKFYLKTILPIIGKMLTSNREAYQYLCNSIHSFIPPRELEYLLHTAGFASIKLIPLFGGIATILIAKKH